MRMRHLALSALSFAALVGAGVAPAAAQDYPAGPGAPPPPFTGPRVEGVLGYDHVGAGSSVSNQNGRDDQKIDGLLYGGGIGYDVNLGGIVLGGEGEITGSTARSSQDPYTSTTFGYGRVRQGRDLYAGARVGFLASPTTMIYAKGGYTNARLRVLAGSTNQSTDTSFNLDGYRVGAGVEHALSPRTYAKVEYRYSNYGRAQIDYASGGQSNKFDVDTDRHQVAVGYGIRF